MVCMSLGTASCAGRSCCSALVASHELATAFQATAEGTEVLGAHRSDGFEAEDVAASSHSLHSGGDDGGDFLGSAPLLSATAPVRMGGRPSTAAMALDAGDAASHEGEDLGAFLAGPAQTGGPGHDGGSDATAALLQPQGSEDREAGPGVLDHERMMAQRQVQLRVALGISAATLATSVGLFTGFVIRLARKHLEEEEDAEKDQGDEVERLAAPGEGKAPHTPVQQLKGPRCAVHNCPRRQEETTEKVAEVAHPNDKTSYEAREEAGEAKNDEKEPEEEENNSLLAYY